MTRPKWCIVQHEAVQNAIEQINERGIINEYNGECAEVNALSRALNHGADLEGSDISVAYVRGSGSTSGLSGSFHEPCEVCSNLLDMFGIKINK